MKDDNKLRQFWINLNWTGILILTLITTLIIFLVALVIEYLIHFYIDNVILVVSIFGICAITFSIIYNNFSKK